MSPSPRPSVENEPLDKKSKFEKRFKINITSDEDGEVTYVFVCKK
jgi:hypothetical protein